MWAIAVAIVCFSDPGHPEPECMELVRNDAMADRWMLSATKEGCEQANADEAFALVRGQGKEPWLIRVTCGRVGV